MQQTSQVSVYIQPDERHFGDKSEAHAFVPLPKKSEERPRKSENLVEKQDAVDEDKQGA